MRSPTLIVAAQPSTDDRPTERVATITAHARQVRFWHTVGTVLVALLYGLGYGSAKLLGLAWFALAWVGTAVALGWKAGARPREGS